MNNVKFYGILFVIFLAWMFVAVVGVSGGLQIAPPESPTYKVTIINNNPHSELGIRITLLWYVRAEDGGWDIIALERWNDEVKVLDLEIGHYSVTQIQKMGMMYKGVQLKWNKIIDYKEFKVLNRNLIITMEG